MAPRSTLSILLGLLPAVLAAQDEPVFRDEIDVRLAAIEVVVTDADGLPVTGLERQDFELRQGRRRLETIHFAAYQDGAAAGAESRPEDPTAARWTPEDRLNLVLYLDYAYMEPGELGDVVDAVRGFLRQGLRPKDRVMLVEANHSLDVRHGFTTLPELVVDELRRLEVPAPRGRAAAEVPRLLQEIERLAERGSDLPSLSRTEHPMMLKTEIDSLVAQTRQEISQATHQLHRLIPTLAGLSGRTALLYVGGSFPSDVGKRLYSAWNNAFGPSSIYQRQRNTTGQDDDFGRLLNTAAESTASEGETHELFRRVADLANANGVTIHVLDTGGLRRSRSFIASRGGVMTEQGLGSSYGERPDSSRRLGNPQAFEMIARATGGRALTHSREFEAELDAVAREMGTYYVLAFRPPQDGVGLTHEIRVRLKGRRRGLEVRHRHAYRAASRDHVAASKAVSALILGEAPNPLRVELAAGAPEADAERRGVVRLPLSVIFPVSVVQWVADEAGQRGQVSIYLTSGDLASGASQVQKVVIPLRFTAEELRRLIDRTIEYKVELPMPASSRKVAVTVRDDLRPLSSSVVLELSASGPSASRLRQNPGRSTGPVGGRTTVWPISGTSNGA